jgi:hypothetical protein
METFRNDSFLSGNGCACAIDDSVQACPPLVHMFDINDWGEMGPLIESHKIALEPRKSLPKLGWMASFSDVDYSNHKNPLRAAAVVYLLIKGEK